MLLVAAGSIFLLPLLVGLVCASERAEILWLCRRFPALAACLEYRAAVDAFVRGRRAATAREDRADSWSGLSHDAFRLRLERDLARRGIPTVPVRDRDLDGYDFALDTGRGRVLVRCEAGDEPVRVSVGRELHACLEETGADGALVVTAAGPSPALSAYAADRPVRVVPPDGLADVAVEATRRAP